MKAIQVSAPGGPDVLQYLDVPQPTPGPGQALVKIDAAGVNFIDTYHRSGLYPIPLPGGLRTMISGIGVFYPDRRPTQRVGILPAREVRPTIAGIRDGRDEVLEAALREILGDSVPEAELVTIARAGRK